MGGDPVPIGRRVAYLRVRRRLSQQSFADRLGKSKSWVDKVERGVRSLERVSTIRDIAAVLRVDVSALLGRDVQPVGLAEQREGVARIGAALSAYEMAFGRPMDREVVSPVWLAREVRHAWMTFQHARYPRLVELLPTLVTEVHRAHALNAEVGRAAVVVEAYRVTAALLVKLDEGSLAWLAADRAMSAAAGDPVLLACAAVQLGQVLRASARAGPVMLAAASQIASGTPEEMSLRGSLLVQAALIAGRAGDDRVVGELLDEAAELAAQVGDGHDHHRTAFGPTAVELARVAAAVEVGDGPQAVARHEKAIGWDGWRGLPVEHRAAHLIDAARAYLQTDDPANAARVLLRAERIAPAEIHDRPGARDVVAQVARDPDAPPTITQLAIGLGVL
ncbi:helix-turn-helix domain-containing protein [Micromonospora zamorensis]|uniref:helix-turn-helix domain-containing protein n=1 Tax=Micromonospora zamorensis TaxID=709883 RepID=UPI00081FD7AF|nr:helix-turn-helix domain-containing protein [Micromonospora zamorensis]SCG63624.1 Helix-turn-helix domain-containing protein [Micromonospora zamorensis]